MSKVAAIDTAKSLIRFSSIQEGLSDPTMELYFASALRKDRELRARRVVGEVTVSGAGVRRVDLGTAPEWEVGKSTLLAVTAITDPGDLDKQKVFQVQRRDWFLLASASSDELVFRFTLPDGAKLVLDISTPVRDEMDVKDADVGPLALLTAAAALKEVAAFYTHTIGSLIGADSADHKGRGREFADRAKELEEEYDQAYLQKPASSRSFERLGLVAAYDQIGEGLINAD